MQKHIAYKKLQNCSARIEKENILAFSTKQKILNWRHTKLLYKTFAKIGDSKQSAIYLNKYILLKDSLLNYRLIASVNEMEFENKMKDVTFHLKQLEHEKRNATNGYLPIYDYRLHHSYFRFLQLHRKNKKLNQSNKALFQKNIELFQSEEKRTNA